MEEKKKKEKNKKKDEFGNIGRKINTSLINKDEQFSAEQYRLMSMRILGIRNLDGVGASMQKCVDVDVYTF